MSQLNFKTFIFVFFLPIFHPVTVEQRWRYAYAERKKFSYRCTGGQIAREIPGHDQAHAGDWGYQDDYCEPDTSDGEEQGSNSKGKKHN